MKKINLRTYQLLGILIIPIIAFMPVFAQPIVDQDKYYNILLAENGEALTNPGHAPNRENQVSKESEAKLTTQKREEKDRRQQWRFIKVNESGNLYMIVNRHFNNYIDVPFGRKNQNETVIGYKNKGGQNQQFYLIRLANNKYLISSGLSGYSLGMVRQKERHCVYREEKPTIGGSVNSGPFSSCNADSESNYVKQVGTNGFPNQQWIIVAIN